MHGMSLAYFFLTEFLNLLIGAWSGDMCFSFLSALLRYPSWPLL